MTSSQIVSAVQQMSLTRTNSSSTAGEPALASDTENTPSLSMPSTPPTSADSFTEANDAQCRDEEAHDKVQRTRSRRSNVTSYNLNVLSGTAHVKSKKTEGGHRDISGETLVDDAGAEPIQRLLGDGIKALDLDWSADALPDDDPAEARKRLAETLKRRKSTRQELVSRAKEGISSKLSILGKRSREAMDKGKADASDKLSDLKRRASLRPRVTEKAAEVEQVHQQQPPAKKLRFSKDVETLKQSISAPLIAGNPLPPAAKKQKRWLAQGLYVGQDRVFDGRLTEEKNRARAAVREEKEGKERKILPMPMFFGQKLLERGRDFKLPFDVFSPLPPGQPKPDEWKKCRRNVFIGDAASIWKDTVLQEVSRCICTEENGCNEDCLNRFMLYECDDANCNLGEEKCTNRSFSDLRKRTKTGRKFDIGVEVMKTLEKGYGVRSNRTFAPGQIIVEYAGEIITQDECDRRMAEQYKDNECYYLMLFDQNMIIDATRGSIARFINHSCEPNCKMVKWIVAGKPRMALFAGEKGVMTGEELTYDYKYEAFSSKNDQECRCGSTLCRGSLGGRPKEAVKEPKEELAHTVKARKRKVDDILSSKDKTKSQNKKGKTALAKSTRNLVANTKAKAAVKASKIRGSISAKPIKRTYSLNKKPSAVLAKPSRAVGRGRKAYRNMSSAVKSRTSAAKGPKGGAAAAEAPRSVRGRSARAVASVRRNVVTTVRGPRRAAALGKSGSLDALNDNGSTIRIIQDA